MARKRHTKIEKRVDKLSSVGELPDDLNRPMSIVDFSRAWGLDPSTVHRGINSGTLEYVTINRRKRVLPPRVKCAG